MTGFTDPRRDPFFAPRNSLSEDDYRPGHGQPGGNSVEREPPEPSVDEARWDYPTPTPRLSHRSGQ
jgi:hypothetical protein